MKDGLTTQSESSDSAILGRDSCRLASWKSYPPKRFHIMNSAISAIRALTPTADSYMLKGS
jgi:hypothetical protein